MGRRRMTAPQSIRVNERWLTFSEAHGDPLLPGIPNEITMAHIAPKLSWRDDYVLSLVSPAWCQAIRSRQVHDARVRSDSSETLVLLSYVHPKGFMAIALYSMKENSWYKLPLLPYRARKMPEAKQYECVSLDGKIYVLGVERARAGVYVFDVAGQRQWQRCGKMHKGRESFGCAVQHGKIYAFGGCYCNDPVYESEVYDPEKNTWTPINTMLSLRCDSKVAVEGDEILVHSGTVFDPNYYHLEGIRLTDPDNEDHKSNAEDYYRLRADSLEVYHPITDEWRVVEDFRRDSQPELMGSDTPEQTFMAEGKFFSISHPGIHAYDMDSNSWKFLHSFSFARVVSTRNPWCMPLVVLPVGNELLALFTSVIHGGNDGTELREILVRSEGLCGENREIVWQKVQIPPSIANWPRDDEGSYRRYFMSPIQL